MLYTSKILRSQCKLKSWKNILFLIVQSKSGHCKFLRYHLSQDEVQCKCITHASQSSAGIGGDIVSLHPPDNVPPEPRILDIRSELIIHNNSKKKWFITVTGIGLAIATLRPLNPFSLSSLTDELISELIIQNNSKSYFIGIGVAIARLHHPQIIHGKSLFPLSSLTDELKLGIIGWHRRRYCNTGSSLIMSL